ncbi:hypothetical protein JHK82_055196 [Glycine max]|nr:hypothetical protein JHK86_055036 [Glycine max]KAG5073826.1 hypothetical protein JHK84_055057 [Glycine max]KAG5076501.1 hypothetical protein JHK82_055196 [Glycine max]
MAGVEHLHQLLEASRKSLSSSKVTSLIDTLVASIVVLASEHFKLHFNALLPAIIDCLDNTKQPILNKVNDEVPFIADLKPSGKYVMEDVHKVKDINARLKGIQPKVHSSDAISGGYIIGEIKHVSVNPKKNSPKAKSSSREIMVKCSEVGGNVGDCAARGADLFESIAAEIISAMILSGTMAQHGKIAGKH